jgi:hypothetical protein
MHPWASTPPMTPTAWPRRAAPPTGNWRTTCTANQRSINGSQQDLPASFAEIDRQTMDFGKKNGVDLDQLQACLKAQSDAAVKASMAEGDKLGVSATPTLFINGERLEGALDADEVKTGLEPRAAGRRCAASAMPAAAECASDIRQSSK